MLLAQLTLVASRCDRAARCVRAVINVFICYYTYKIHTVYISSCWQLIENYIAATARETVPSHHDHMKNAFALFEELPADIAAESSATVSHSSVNHISSQSKSQYRFEIKSKNQANELACVSSNESRRLRESPASRSEERAAAGPPTSGPYLLLLTLACQRIQAWSSEFSVYLVQDYGGAFARSVFLEVRTATGSGRAPQRQDRVLRPRGGSPVVRRLGAGRGKKPGGKWAKGLFSPCRSRVMLAARERERRARKRWRSRIGRWKWERRSTGRVAVAWLNSSRRDFRDKRARECTACSVSIELL